jgi:hypothetical protein
MSFYFFKFIFQGINLFEYFSSTCYKGFGDDEAGFYYVYNKGNNANKFCQTKAHEFNKLDYRLLF